MVSLPILSERPETIHARAVTVVCGILDPAFSGYILNRLKCFNLLTYLYPRALQDVYYTTHLRALSTRCIVLLQTMFYLLDYFGSSITMRLNR